MNGVTTHPNDAALVGPLFAFGESEAKKVFPSFRAAKREDWASHPAYKLHPENPQNPFNPGSPIPKASPSPPPP